MRCIAAILFAVYCVLHVNSYVLNEAAKEAPTAVSEDDPSNDISRRSIYAPKLTHNRHEINQKEKHMVKSGKHIADNSLEKVVLALKNGVKNLLKKHNVRSDFLDKYAKKVVDYIKGNTGPLFRAASEKYNINPEVVHFRSDKPTLKIDINPSTISKVISDFLHSETFVRNFDNVVQQVAVVYRTLKDD